MARCDNCLANKVCDHHRFGFENCGSYISAADVAPKSEVAREFIEIINDRIDNIRARIPYGGRAQGKTLAVEKMRLLESLKVEIAKKYTEDEG